MKLKINDVINSIKTLKEISETELSKVPFSVAMAIAKNKTECEIVANIFEAKRIDCAKKYAFKNDDGSIKMADDDTFQIEDMNGFASEISNILNEEVDVVIQKIKYSELQKMGVNIAYIEPIYFMIEE